MWWKSHFDGNLIWMGNFCCFFFLDLFLGAAEWICFSSDQKIHIKQSSSLNSTILNLLPKESIFLFFYFFFQTNVLHLTEIKRSFYFCRSHFGCWLLLLRYFVNNLSKQGLMWLAAVWQMSRPSKYTYRIMDHEKRS